MHEEGGPLHLFLDDLFVACEKSPQVMGILALHVCGLWVQHPNIALLYLSFWERLLLYGSPDNGTLKASNLSSEVHLSTSLCLGPRPCTRPFTSQPNLKCMHGVLDKLIRHPLVGLQHSYSDNWGPVHVLQAEFFSEPGNLCIDPDVQEAYAGTEMAARVTAVAAVHQLATKASPQPQHWFGSNAAAGTTDAGVFVVPDKYTRTDQRALYIAKPPGKEHGTSTMLCRALLPCILKITQIGWRSGCLTPAAKD